MGQEAVEAVGSPPTVALFTDSGLPEVGGKEAQ